MKLYEVEMRPKAVWRTEAASCIAMNKFVRHLENVPVWYSRRNASLSHRREFGMSRMPPYCPLRRQALAIAADASTVGVHA